jgi:hypothetical protein
LNLKHAPWSLPTNNHHHAPCYSAPGRFNRAIKMRREAQGEAHLTWHWRMHVALIGKLLIVHGRDGRGCCCYIQRALVTLPFASQRRRLTCNCHYVA